MVYARVRLANALQDASAPHDIWSRAILGFYDDFQSCFPYPKIALIDDLEKAGMIPFAERVRAGEFDSTEKEAQFLISEKRKNLFQWRKMRNAEKRKS
jgi:hypothetical protein